MDLSVVIPVKNEAGNIAPLVAEIAAALDGIAAYEIVYVDDGSDDSTAAEIRRRSTLPPPGTIPEDAGVCSGEQTGAS